MTHPRTGLGPGGPPAPWTPVEPAKAVALPDGVPEQLLDSSPVGVLACDGRGVLRSANRTARRMLPWATVGEVLHGPALSQLAAADPTGGEVELDLPDRVVTARPAPLSDGWTGWYLADVTDQRARLDALLTERSRSRFLARASSRLGRSLHPGRAARTVAELAAELVDSAVVVLPPVSGAVEWFRTRAGTADSGWELVGGLPEPVRSALRGVPTTPDPLLLAALTGEPWTATGPPARAAVVPLPGDDAPAGVLVLLGGHVRAGGPDAATVTEFAERAGMALTVAALYAQRSRTAEVLKRSVLEPRLPTVDGVVLAAAHRPAEAGLLVGGDFYDVRATPDGGAELVVGDVCGKGVDAAVTAGKIRQSVLALRRVRPDPVGLLELLNTILLEVVAPDADPRFATMVLGSAYPLPGGGVRLLLAGGGHPPPLVVRHGGVEVVEIGGVLVGALHPARFHTRIVDLAPGEACVLYTDGIVEARGGLDGRTLFGEDRLAELLDGCEILPAPGIVDRILDRTTRWLADGDHDDMAVLVVQAPITPSTPAPRAHLRVVQTEEEWLRSGRPRR